MQEQFEQQFAMSASNNEALLTQMQTQAAEAQAKLQQQMDEQRAEREAAIAAENQRLDDQRRSEMEQQRQNLVGIRALMSVNDDDEEALRPRRSRRTARLGA